MIINHNMQSINAHRQMGVNQANGQKSMEKLSSGLRINRAGDDAAGLAISEKMRGQIRGLDQAGRNAQDGISLIQTAEGALNETHSILQRMKELATQAANGTNTESDRSEIQKEIDQLTSEVNRIGNTTEFNTQKLLDGGASSDGIMTGVTNAKGTGAQGGKIVAGSAVDFATKDPSTFNDTDTLKISVTDANGTEQEFEIDGNAFKTLWGQTDAGKAGVNATDEMKNKALKEVLGSMSAANFELPDGTTRTVTLDEVVDLNVSDNGVLSMQSKIGGEDITIVQAGSTDSFTTMLGLGTIAADIVGTGTDQKEATIFGSKAVTGTDTFNADDFRGKSFDVEYNGLKAKITLAHDFGTAGSKTVTAADLVTEMNKQLDSVFGAGKVALSISTNPNKVGDTDTYFKLTTTTSASDVTNGVDPSVKISGDNINKLFGSVASDKTEVGGSFDIKLQVGASNGQSINMEIEDMRSQALKISAATAGDKHETVNGAKFNEIKSATNGTDNTATEYSLDVSSFESATAAIEVYDNAIKSVSAQRSSLGALQNRLEHTINNLGTSSENLTAAESRIRDVDMAKEMMNFTKNNVLNQAAQAMLAQANQQPNQVLQLLR